MALFKHKNFNRIFDCLNKIKGSSLDHNGIIVIMGEVKDDGKICIHLSIQGDENILKTLTAKLLKQSGFKELIAKAKADYLINRKPDYSNIIQES